MKKEGRKLGEMLVVLMVTLAMIVPAAPFLVSGGGSSTAASPVASPVSSVNNKELTTIRLKMCSFDPLVDGYGLPVELTTNEEDGHYIIQFYGDRGSYADRQVLKDMGVKFLGYLGGKAWVVYMSPSLKREVEKMDMVRWIGPYQPGWKIDPSINSASGVQTFRIYLWNNNPDTLEKNKKDIKLPSIFEKGYFYLNGKKQKFGGIQWQTSHGDLRKGFEMVRENLQQLNMEGRKAFEMQLRALGFDVVRWNSDTEVEVRGDVSAVPSAAFLSQVKWIDIKPTGQKTFLTDVQRQEFVETSHSNGFDGSNASGKNGAGIVGGIYCIDGVDDTHANLADNIKIYGSNTPGDHATACVGTTVGYTSPKDGDAEGTMPGYSKSHYWLVVTDGDTSDYATAASNIAGEGGRIISNSFQWVGGGEGQNSEYTADSEKIDQSVVDNDVVWFIAAGNDDAEGGPEVCSHAIAKNAFAVGGIDQKGTADLSDDVWDSGASSVNAIYDDRVKPDISAPFTVTTTANGGGTTSVSGTSFSAPFAAGVAGDLLDMYQNEHFGPIPSKDPSAALIRAMVVATSYRTDDTEHLGWGVVRADWAEQLGDHVYFEDGIALAEGEEWNVTVNYSGIAGPYGEGLQITLTWIDPPGEQVSGGRALYNDLDLKVTNLDTGDVYYGNLGMKTNRWTQTTSFGPNEWDSGIESTTGNQYTDDNNTIENVFIPDSSAAGTYKVEVLCDEINSGSTQKFAIFIANVASGRGQIWIGDKYVDPEYYNALDIANVTVVDADLNTDPSAVDTCTVHISSNADPKGFNMTLQETGPNTNKFFGEFGFSRPSPDGTNDGLSHPEADPPLIAVNAVDTVTVSYNDTSPVAQTLTDTCYYDEVPPHIYGVKIGDVVPNGMHLIFETDEEAIGFPLYPYVVNQSTGEADVSKPATVDQLRNQSVEVEWYLGITKEYLRAYNFFSESGGDEAFDWAYGRYLTHHDMFPTFEDENQTYAIAIYAEDRAGNAYVDWNNDNYYVYRTQDQPFTLFLYYDGGGIFYDYAANLIDYATREFYNSEDDDYNWTPEQQMSNYSDPWDQNHTLREFWENFTADTNNVLMWCTGAVHWSFAYYSCTLGTCIGGGYKEYAVDGTWTFDQGEMDNITSWQNSGGHSLFDGHGIWEDGNDRSAVDTFIQNNLHAKREDSGGGDTTAIGYDVTCGYLELSGSSLTFRDEQRRQIAMNRNTAAPVGSRYDFDWPAAENVSINWLYSSEVSGDEYSANGGNWELAWGEDLAGRDGSDYYGAVSYEDTGTGERTFFGAAGMLGTDFYAWKRGAPEHHNYFAKLEPFTAAILDWLAPHPILIEGRVTDGTNPIEGATVTVYAAGDKTTALGGAVTNATGYYQIKMWAEGTYDLYASKTGYTEDSITGLTIDYTGSPYTDKDFVLSNAVGNISGTVFLVDAVNGRSYLGGATVLVYNTTAGYTEDNPIAQTQTDIVGKYLITDLPAAYSPYTVKVYGGRWIRPDYFYNSTTQTVLSDVVVTAQQTTTNVNATVYSGAISGYVFESDGVTPIEGAYVFAVEYGHPSAWSASSGPDDTYAVSYSFTDESGAYVLPLVSDNTGGKYGDGYVVTASADGRYMYATWDEVNDTLVYHEQAYGYENETWQETHMGDPLSPTAVKVSGSHMTTDINFTLDSVMGWITGTVYLPDGTTPAVGAKVTATLVSPEYMVGNLGTQVVGYTDAYGHYNISVPAGTNGTAQYNVSAAKSPYKGNTSSSNPFYVYAKQTTTGIDVVLGPKPSSFVALYVVDDGGTSTNSDWTNSLDNYQTPDGTPFSYDTWITQNSGAPTAADMSGYNLVLWATGNDYSDMVLIDDEAEIESYLDQGGAMLLSSQDGLYMVGGVDDFFYNYMGVSSANQDCGAPADLPGISGHPITDPWGSSSIPYADDSYTQGYEDSVTPISGAMKMFSNNRGINYDSGGFRTVFWPWPYEDLDTSVSDVNTLFNRTVDWLLGYSNNAPVLVNHSVSPESGDPGTTFTWTVTYVDADDDAPEYVHITIDGTTYNMTKQDSGDNTYTDGCIYTYSMVLNEEGVHQYNFSAKDTNTEYVPSIAVGELGPYDGPEVNDSTPPSVTHDQSRDVGYIDDNGAFIVSTTFDTSQNIVVYANATDNVGIQSVTLNYTDVNGGGHAIAMDESGSQIYPHLYKAVIPAQSKGGKVYYAITAKDGAGNTNTTATFVVTVKGASDGLPANTPYNLNISVSGSDVVLSWEKGSDTGNADSETYKVYYTTNRFEPWPWSNVTNVSATSWTHAGAAGDGNTWYYIVRAVDADGESGNSTMAVKMRFEFRYYSGLAQDNWISLPYNCSWLASLNAPVDVLTASDIVMAIEGGLDYPGNDTYISSVKRWNASLQGTDSTNDEFRYKSSGFGTKGWVSGTDFVIHPGDGISLYLSGNTPSFNWTVVGTDLVGTQKFKYYSGLAQDNWISIPYTMKDVNGDGVLTAKDIVLAIEGGLDYPGNDTYISSVKRWNASLQGTDSTNDEFRYKSSGFGTKGWVSGTDFVIHPGDGISLYLSGNTPSFNWTPPLITPPRPESTYTDPDPP